MQGNICPKYFRPFCPRYQQVVGEFMEMKTGRNPMPQIIYFKATLLLANSRGGKTALSVAGRKCKQYIESHI